MSRKMVMGFLAGLVAASGVSYLLTHPKPAAEPASPASSVVAKAAPPDVPPAPVSEDTVVPQTMVSPEAARTSTVRKFAPVRRPKPRLAPARAHYFAAPASAHEALPETVAVLPPTPPSAPPPARLPSMAQLSAAPTLLTPPSAPPPARLPSMAQLPAAPPLLTPTPAPPPTRLRSTELSASSRFPARTPATVLISRGTSLSVRLDEALSSDRNREGDEFTGTLDEALVVDRLVIAERGARVVGRVAESVEVGRVLVLARLRLELTRLYTSDGQRVTIRTAFFGKQDYDFGGAVTVALDRPAILPVASVVKFRMAEPIILTERLN